MIGLMLGIIFIMVFMALIGTECEYIEGLQINADGFRGVCLAAYWFMLGWLSIQERSLLLICTACCSFIYGYLSGTTIKKYYTSGGHIYYG